MASRWLALVGLALLLLPAAVLVGCSNSTPSTGTADSNVESVKIDGEWFHLELALDGASRFKGLSGRDHIEPDGGMLFVFKSPASQRFVMRDCFTDIDIIFLDAAGRITAMHHMPKEPPRNPDTEPIDNQATGTSSKYEARLPKYSSRFPAQYVIELAGGTLERLDIKEGDQIDLDLEGLKARAK